MANAKPKNLAAKKAAARKMESRYKGLAEVVSTLDRQRYEALTDHWRAVAENLERREKQGDG